VCQITKTCHHKLKPSQCSQHCQGGGTELANETGNSPVQRVVVAQCCFQQETQSTFKKGHGIKAQIYSIGGIPQSLQLQVQVT